MNKYIYIIIFAVYIAVAYTGQEKNVGQSILYQNTITLEPLYFFNNGLKINYERNLFKNTWIETGITGYKYDKVNFQNIAGDAYFWDSDITKAYGYGIDLHYKWFPTSIMYLSAGFQVRHHNITNDDTNYSFIEYKEDGLTFITYTITPVTQNINRFATCLRIGLQSRQYHRISVGGFAGFSYIHTNTSGSIYNNWNSPDMLTFSGIMPELGFKIGVRF